MRIIRKRRGMGFQVGDKVIHSIHGLGEIVQIEEKIIHDLSAVCYIFQTGSLTIWIPVDDPQQHSLRLPAKPDEFVGLSGILTSPSNTLLEDRVLRKEQLMALLRDGQLRSICEVVRDLTRFKRSKKLNDQEKFILERATNSLLVEWAYSLEISQTQAHQAMVSMMDQ